MENLAGDNSVGGNSLGDGNNIITEGEEEKNPNIASYTEDGVPIPVGFKYVEGTKDTGVVVENEADGSQFVWVPVTEEIVAYGLGTTNRREPDVVIGDGTQYDNDSTNLNIINNILGTTYSNSEDFLTALQEDFNLMAESVNKNNGFYVGRYETSLNGSVAQSVKGETSLNAETANTWYGLYAYQKAYSTDSVQGSMIWGSQYDRMMDWMGDAVSTSIGDKRNLTRETGSDSDDLIKNIYDLYGNSFERTLEAIDTNRRMVRGGYYAFDFMPNICLNIIDDAPTSNNSDHGSRLALYIK